MRWSYSCLGHNLWPEVAFPNAFPFGNVSTGNLNTALELPLPRTHFVARGSIPQRIPIWQRLHIDSQHCAGATLASDTFRGQR